MLNIVYAGSPEISALPFSFLVESGECHISAVITNPPAPQGRSKTLVPTPVALAAEKFNSSLNAQGFHPEQKDSQEPIAILTPDKLDSSFRETIAALKPNLLVCFAYGKIFGPKFLSLFPMGGINLHPSLLPKYRGCAPVPAAILNKEKTTGITIQRIGLEMDAGDILLQKTIPLTGFETSGSLLDDVSRQGGNLLLEVIKRLENASLNNTEVHGITQNNAQATFCTMLKKEDGAIDWTKSAFDIDAQIRAFSPWPLAFTTQNGLALRIHKAAVYSSTDGKQPFCNSEKTGSTQSEVLQNAIPGTVIGSDKKQGILIQTGNGILAVTCLQWQAKNAVSFKDFLNGSHNFIGTKLDTLIKRQ